MAISFRDKQHRWIARRGARRALVHAPGGRWLQRYIVSGAAVAAMTSAAANDVNMTREMRSDAMSAHLARSWRWVLLRGVLAVVTGAVALLPGVASVSLVALFGAYMIADAMLLVASVLWTARRYTRWSWLGIEGLLTLAAGIFLVVSPAAAMPSLITLLAARGVAAGTAMAAAAFRLRRDHGRWSLVFVALTSISCGLLLFPVPGAAVMTHALGAYAVLFGTLLVLLACQLRARRAIARRSS